MNSYKLRYLVIFLAFFALPWMIGWIHILVQAVRLIFRVWGWLA